MQANEFPETIEATFKLKRERVDERGDEIEIVYHLDLEMFAEDAKRPVVANVIIKREALDEVTPENAIGLITDRIKFDMFEGLTKLGILDVPGDTWGDDDGELPSAEQASEPDKTDGKDQIIEHWSVKALSELDATRKVVDALTPLPRIEALRALCAVAISFGHYEIAERILTDLVRTDRGES